MDGVIDTLTINVKVSSGNTKSELKSIESEFTKLGSILKKSISTNVSATSSFGNMTSKIRKLSGVLTSAVQACGKWFNGSNDYVEAVNLFSVTMGKGADAAKKYADNLQNLMGIDIKDWMNYQGSFNQLLEGYGLDNKISNEMSQQLTQISYDLSSLWNVDVDTAFKKVQSGMSGQIKGLKVWGINLSVAQLKETALAHGIELSTSKMTEAQKATLRYITLMEKTTNIQGDMARTIITPANSIRILTQQMTQLKRALGDIVSVLVVDFIPYVQLAIKLLTKLAQRMADCLGFELPEIDYTGLNQTLDFSDDLEDSLSDANNSAKKLKKTLLGFDEINKLNDSSDSDSFVLGGGLPSDLGLGDYASSLGYDFTEGIELPDFDEIKNKLKDVLWYVGAIGAGFLAWSIGRTLSQAGLLSITFGQLLGVTTAVIGAVILIKGAIDTLNNGADLQSFTEMFVGAAIVVGGLAIAFGSAGAAIGALVSGVVIAVTGIIDAVKNGLNILNGAEIMGGFLLVGTAIGGLIGGPAGPAIGALIGLVIGAIADLIIYIVQNWEEIKEQISTFTSWFDIHIVKPIKDFYNAYIKPAASAIYNVAIRPIIETIIILYNAIKEYITVVWNNITTIVSGIWNAIKTVADKIGEIVKTIWEIIKAVVGYVWSEINEVIDDIMERLKPIAKWFYNNVLSPVYNFVVKVTDWITDKINKVVNIAKNIGITVANGVANVVKAALNEVFSFAENIINFFIGGLNAVVGIVNNIPGVNISRVEEISIPHFATGGFPDKGGLFIAHESGPELVGTIGNKSAVVNNDQIVASVEGGVYRGMRSALAESRNNAGNDNSTLVVMIDGEVVHKGFVKWHNEEVKVSGHSPLKV